MERLQKVIAHAGITSRRKAEEYIVNGRVKVNGKIVRELGTQVGKSDLVEVDNVPIYKEEYGYYLFYKPKGVISAVADDKGRKVVTDYFTHIKERIYPVGRLDYDTSGLLLLTNDGEFSQRLTHPSHEVDKVYVAKVKGLAKKHDFLPLTKGIKIDEGRNHQVKNMLQAVGYPVQKLKREKYGDLTLKGLRPGEYRSLNKKEISVLMNQSK